MALEDPQRNAPHGVRPRVDLRIVLFSVSEGRLFVALEQRGKRKSLPRGAPWPEENLDAAAARVLSAELGIAEQYLEQLYTITQGRAEAWTVTVTYLGIALAGPEGPPVTTAAWFDASGLPSLDGVDTMIVDYALLRLRAKLGYTTIAFHLLPSTFSFSELQGVYEAVLNRRLDKRNFRRSIQAADLLEATGETRREGSHRPARLFRFRAAHDAGTYLTPAWATGAERESG